MKAYLRIYNAARAIVFSAILIAVGLFLAVYVLVSIPVVQRAVCNRAELEASKFLGSRVTIGEIHFHPFNRLILNDVDVYSPDGGECIHIDEAGAGIRIIPLLKKGRIDISFAEVLGLDAKIRQEASDKPLNIQFLIDAFAPKEKKEPTKLDLSLHAVVIRRSNISFDKEWLPKAEPGRFDPNHACISNLRADVAIPLITNDSVAVELKRLAFRERSGLDVQKVAANVSYGKSSGLLVRDLMVNLPGSSIHSPEVHLPAQLLASGEGSIALNLPDNSVTPSDFSPLLPALSQFNDAVKFSLQAFASKQDIEIGNFTLRSKGVEVDVAGKAMSYAEKSREIDIDKLRLTASKEFVSSLVPTLKIPSKDLTGRLLSSLGFLDVDITGKYSDDSSHVKGYVDCGLGIVDLDASLSRHGKSRGIVGTISAEKLDNLIPMLVPGLNATIHSLQADIDITLAGGVPDGIAEVVIPSLSYGALTATDLRIFAQKEGEDASLSLTTDEGSLYLMADVQGVLNKVLPSFAGDLAVRGTIPYSNALFSSGDFGGYDLGGNVSFDIIGGDINTMEGFVDLHKFYLKAPDKSRSLAVDHVMMNMEMTPDSLRNVSIDSDLLKGTIKGNYNVAALPSALQGIASRVLPSWIKAPEYESDEKQDMDIDLVLLPNNNLTEFFNLPVSLLTDVEISGSVDTEQNVFDLTVQTPYLQQGKDKLIRDVRLGVGAGGEPTVMSLEASAVVPGKDCKIKVGIDATGSENNLTTDVRWRFDKKSEYNGHISMEASAARNPETGAPSFNVLINPSQFQVNDTTWHVSRGTVDYADGKVTVNSLRAWRDDQYVGISGVASANPADTLTVSMQNFDLDYLFDTLSINFVEFGGRATGKVYATDLLTPCPKAYTDSIGVKNLTYFGSLLGDDAILSSRWINDEMKVTIGADIRENGKRTALVDGGIWVTRDSLSLSLDADKVNVGFLTPILKEFSSGVKGRASGRCHLFGTFSDVDLEGRLFADTIAMQVGFTRVWYGGSDSVIIDPGHIEIPRFKAYDQQGHYAYFSGVLDHKYFRAPVFEFQVRDAKDLLLLDTRSTTEQNNWYGTIYGTGGGTIKGGPGFVAMTVDMATAPKSTFNFILDNRRVAQDYDFLTFTDKRKEQMIQETEIETTIDFESMFRKKKKNDNQGPPSTFNLDLRATITPDATITLVMNPASGDKITAHGNGSLQLLYDTGKDDLGMFGKYTITDGNYNFTLQDIIIKDFTIREGSSVAFNGDPMHAVLDINALYRTTTNLSDLDKSFSTDRDLNRTNVPVDAVLKLKGDINTPEIDFDIELPTLTADVQRKVMSIISTDDMMSRQILYLLALGKFYTPEFNGSSNGGGEIASLATTTISSQISSLLGQLSNYFTVAPSIRSDKGDFSDLEFDVALSSRLLNNRLLINGNFGYRDPSTSSSTFIGDFDIEYLLTRNGKLRLKAYNHFNDQNYYLKSSLTTQGVGVLWRHDFGNRPKRVTLPLPAPAEPTEPAEKKED